MKLKYTWREETSVRVQWKPDKVRVKPGEVFECSERTGREYLNSHSESFTLAPESKKFLEWQFWLGSIIVPVAIAVIWWAYFTPTEKSDKPSDTTITDNTSLNVQNDARDVANGIVISGWEKSGDYLGYLVQITGFYSRHKDRYPVEYETYNKQLEYWTGFLNEARMKNRFVYSDELSELYGLVTSGRSSLEMIAKSK